MKAKQIFWVFVGIGTVLGGAWAYTTLTAGKVFTSGQAIKIIAKALGKDPVEYERKVRASQKILADRGMYDFGIDDDFLIHRAQALLDGVEIFIWRTGNYNSHTGTRA